MFFIKSDASQPLRTFENEEKPKTAFVPRGDVNPETLLDLPDSGRLFYSYKEQTGTLSTAACNYGGVFCCLRHKRRCVFMSFNLAAVTPELLFKLQFSLVCL